MKNKNTTLITLATIAVVVIALVALSRTERSAVIEERSTLSNRDFAMICTTDMATKFHIHPNLELIRNGEPEPLQSDIGIRAGCMNPLHTHGTDGTIHVESPEPRDFTLGDFFAVWGRPFPEGARVTVNGRASAETENLILGDEDRIVLSYESKK